MKFETTIIGCGAATPTLRHKPSSQLVNVHDRMYMVDCGEGTQLELRRYRIRFQRIDHVFISHLHGDHYLGLIGYMSSLHLLGRQSDLHIFGPPDLKGLIEQHLRVSQTYLSYHYEFHDLQFDAPHILLEDQHLEVISFPLRHRIDCCGFLFKEKPRALKVNKDVIAKYRLKSEEVVKLKRGEDIILENGNELTSAECTEAPPPPRSFAYCSDTVFDQGLVPILEGVNLLYHESTFLETEVKRAKETFHSTASQAATIAKMCGAGQLLLGHYSSRYENEEAFLVEAKAVFENSLAGQEGETYPVV